MSPPFDILAVVGPTGSGKTALAIELAQVLDTEIVSADSMQFYRGMEIGTGAPTAEELAAARHHFVGCLDPSESMSAGKFEALARPVVEGLNAAGQVAVVAGGSGLYVRALIDGLAATPSALESIRAELAERAASKGVTALYAELRSVDPAYADTIGDNDLRRIVRGLEVYALTGKPFTAHHAEQLQHRGAFHAKQIAIDWPRDILYQRINARVDRMIEAGFIDEVKQLLEQGLAKDLLRLRALGYREIMGYLRGKHDLKHATEQMKQQSRRYAKRQLSWFRGDDRIEWIPPDQLDTVASQMKQNFN